jgi:hypothetical protein
MTPNEIHERSTEICRRLTREVSDLVPVGIGSWAGAWQIVGLADSDFIAALCAWEADPANDRAKQRVRDTYSAVVDAWKEAARGFEREALAG